MKKLTLILCSVFVFGCKPEETPKITQEKIKQYVETHPVKEGEDYRIGYEIINQKETKVLYIKDKNGKFKKVIIKD